MLIGISVIAYVVIGLLYADEHGEAAILWPLWAVFYGVWWLSEWRRRSRHDDGSGT